MQLNWLFLSFCLLLGACGNNNTATDTKDSAPSTASSETETEDSDDNRMVLHQMPNGDQIAEAYDAILEKADADDPELMEVHVSFSKSITGPERDDSNLSVKLVSPKDKNKIVFYRYDFPEKRVREPVDVTLTTGIGSTEKFIDTYDGFRASLFKKSDILHFDKADEVYQEAIAKSEYGAKDCYIDGLQFMYFPNGLRGSVAVQSTRSSSAHKSFSIDREGNMTAY